MRLPILNGGNAKTRQQVITFGGVHYGEGGQDGQLEESRNLSSGKFPTMSARGGRRKAAEYANATAIHVKGGMLVVSGTDLLYDGVKVGTVSPGKKQMVTVNNKVVIMPDKVIFDTEMGAVRSMEAEYTAESGMLEFADSKTLWVHLGAFKATILSSGNKGGTKENGNSGLTIHEDTRPFDGKISSVSVNSETGVITFGDNQTCPRASEIREGMLFYDRSLGIDGVTTWGVVTKVYETFYVVIPGSGSTVQKDKYGFDYDVYGVRGTSYGEFSGFEGMNFREGDTVEIEGCTSFPQNNKVATIRGFYEAEVSGEKVYGLVFGDNTFPQTGTEQGKVSIRRKIPSLSVICESNNRLWGAEGNTIYASALGDPTNIYTYDALSTDSYAVGVATEGIFTACCGYGNAVLFFKEDTLHKILGAYPAQYEMHDYTIPGVEAGSEGSLVNINEVLYYKGREGVFRYAGGSPELISDNFGRRRFGKAAAGGVDGRYYISMQDDETQAWGLWCYDIRNGIWLQEDETQAVDFASTKGELYFVAADGIVMQVNPKESEERVKWSATTCRIDETVMNRKAYSRIMLRAELEEGSWIEAEISCDGEPFRKVYTSRNKRAKTMLIPILPKRCDSFRIRLSGEGGFIIRSMVREFALGSEY